MFKKNRKLGILGVFTFLILLGFVILFIFNSHIMNIRNTRQEIVVSSGTFAVSDTLYSVLYENEVSLKEIYQIKNAMEQKVNINKVYAGDTYELIQSTSNEFLEFYYHPIDPEKYYHVIKTTYGIVCDEIMVQLERILTKKSGYIETTLYDSMLENGLSPEMVMRFADIFSWQIDFFTDIQKGDVYELVYEQFKNNGKVVKDGKILIARYNGKRVPNYYGILFEDTPGYADYYDLNGNSLKKMFLKAPLNYRRISSYFTMRRFHPILKYWRPHQGIDYAAPTGTPVSAIGDGIVTFVGWKGQYGKCITIKHNSTYTTSYGHLSRFAKGIKKGKHVTQGQVIGYVGSTGLATGPHLDFRITKNGQFVNFLKLKFPPHKSISEKNRPTFEKIKSELLQILKSNIS
jgi:murein DD-endopeptidase MepM/ murein hydrolase activator NlpD